jgi:hypothetical protein
MATHHISSGAFAVNTFYDPYFFDRLLAKDATEPDDACPMNGPAGAAFARELRADAIGYALVDESAGARTLFARYACLGAVKILIFVF